VHLSAEEVTPVGEGAIASLIAERRARLAAEGLIDRPRRPIPLLPAGVGVVCGAEAAVRKDIESVIADRCPGYPVHFEETSVSGPGAELSIVDALQRVAARPGVEIVILARGGGDAPSLLPWSTEEVCRAVAACPVPVVSAIGHEGDRPLCDEVADLRCGTPSLAATAVLPDLVALGRSVDATWERAGAALRARMDAGGRRIGAVDLDRAVQGGLAGAEGRLDRAGLRLAAAHPAGAVREAARRLAGLDWRRPFWEAVGRAEGAVDAEGRHLRALSPQRTLERGYAVVSGPDGAVLRSVHGLKAGDVVRAQLAVGRVTASVVAVEGGDGG
jgi:exodeoxyribonuclease VII large subunit